MRLLLLVCIMASLSCCVKSIENTINIPSSTGNEIGTTYYSTTSFVQLDRSCNATSLSLSKEEAEKKLTTSGQFGYIFR